MFVDEIKHKNFDPHNPIRELDIAFTSILKENIKIDRYQANLVCCLSYNLLYFIINS